MYVSYAEIHALNDAIIAKDNGSCIASNGKKSIERRERDNC
jgi:hypothetical protein